MADETLQDAMERITGGKLIDRGGERIPLAEANDARQQDRDEQRMVDAAHRDGEIIAERET